MKTTRILWLAPLALSLAGISGKACLAQSVPAVAVQSLQGDEGGVTRGARNDVMVAAALPGSWNLAAYNAEDSASEPAEQRPETPGRSDFSRIGIAVKVSTLGAGIEAATPLFSKFNLRGGFNMFRYSRPIADNGIQYNGQLRFQSAEAHLDWFPIRRIHVSPGLLLYNGNQIAATASVPGGQSFSAGGTTYVSDPSNPVTGTGKMDFMRVAPSIMAGIGNLVPRNGKRFSFLFEAGVAYQGSAHVALNLAGNVCDTTGTFCRSISGDSAVQANIQAQAVKLQNDVYRFFPIISLGVGFSF
jgi:hypothetical protein